MLTQFACARVVGLAHKVLVQNRWAWHTLPNKMQNHPNIQSMSCPVDGLHNKSILEDGALNPAQHWRLRYISVQCRLGNRAVTLRGIITQLIVGMYLHFNSPLHSRGLNVFFHSLLQLPVECSSLSQLRNHDHERYNCRI